MVTVFFQKKKKNGVESCRLSVLTSWAAAAVVKRNRPNYFSIGRQ